MKVNIRVEMCMPSSTKKYCSLGFDFKQLTTIATILLLIILFVFIKLRKSSMKQIYCYLKENCLSLQLESICQRMPSRIIEIE